MALADAVRVGCESDLASLSAMFGGIVPAALPFHINLDAGVGSDGHATCLDTDIHCPAANSSPESVLTTIDAEVAEVLMATQNLGFNCGYSNGEALSRVLPTVLYPSRAWAFSVSNSWFNSTNPSRPDWVSNTETTDQNFVSIGCGTLFLNYLADQLTFTWHQIISAAASTLAQTAANLGVANAFAAFSSLLAHHFPTTVQTNLPDDNPFPLLSQPPLYIRHNPADNGTSHTAPLPLMPDIIVRNSVVASSQFSTQISLYSDTESDPNVLTGQQNFVYLRIWNRGPNASNVEASVYWSPTSTLVRPTLWHHTSPGIVLNVPAPGNIVEVSAPLGWDKDNIPTPGHYCFVATVRNAQNPAPPPGSCAPFDDCVTYIYAHNNITWRNFNVVAPALSPERHFGHCSPFLFYVSGAWDKARVFAFEVLSDLPQGSRLALQVPEWLGRGLRPAPVKVEEHVDAGADPDDRRRLRIHVDLRESHPLGRIELRAGIAVKSHLLVHIPKDRRDQPHEVAVRQLYEGREVGRITWRVAPMTERNAEARRTGADEK